MEYQQRSNSSDANDHENSDYILAHGPYAELVQQLNNHFVEQEHREDLTRFDVVWDSLTKCVQEPKRDNEKEFAGFTGHRLITLGNPDEQYAVGFYMRTWKAVQARGQKVIHAEWRRVYPDDDRRIERETSDEVFQRLDYLHSDDAAAQALLRLEILFERFIAADSYGDDSELSVA